MVSACGAGTLELAFETPTLTLPTATSNWVIERGYIIATPFQTTPVPASSSTPQPNPHAVLPTPTPGVPLPDTSSVPEQILSATAEAAPNTLPRTTATAASRALTWETYRATGVYSLRYPIELYSVRQGQAHIRALWPGVVVVEPNEGLNDSLNQPASKTYRLTIALNENSERFTLDDPTALLSDGDILGQYARWLLDEAHPVREFYIDNTPAYRVDDLPVVQAGTLTQIITIRDDVIYLWHIQPVQVSGDDRNWPLIEEILSTFKFD
jgi:hypothetical protein